MKEPKPCIRAFLRLLLPLLLLVFFVNIPLHADAAVTSTDDIRISKGGKFVHISGQWYKYLQKDGTYAKDCLMNINGKIYYFSPKGYRQFSWKQIGNDYYYFGTYLEGYMYKLRWLKKPEGTYLLKKSGKRATGWLNYQGHTYYFDKDGIRASGWRIINGKKYYFGTKDQGYKYTGGWLYYKNRIFYMKKDGTPTYGWATISGNRYYFDQNGRAYKGHHKIDGIDYYFSSKGALLYSGPNLSISSDCAVLIDAATGKVIYNKNGNKKHSNASTTKIMTYILAVENSPASLNNRVKVSAYAASQEPTKLYMQAGDSFKMKDLLYSLMLGSHNDTAVAIAESVSGSTAKFADKMNTRAKQLGCTSTHFVTPNGLDNGLNHYTTASDLAKIARYAWLHARSFQKVVGTSSYSFRSTQGRSYTTYTTNALLGTTPGVKGMKTGYTNKAGYCFAGVVKAKSGKTYISVTLGASSSTARWNDSRTLLNYAYNNL